MAVSGSGFRDRAALTVFIAALTAFIEEVIIHNEAMMEAKGVTREESEQNRITFVMPEFAQLGPTLQQPEPDRLPRIVLEHHLENCRLTLLQVLECELSRLKSQYQLARTAEFLQVALGEAAQAIPESKAMDKILRYETTIKRQLYRAMDQLERLQRRRIGEYVPPPVKMGIQRED